MMKTKDLMKTLKQHQDKKIDLTIMINSPKKENKHTDEEQDEALLAEKLGKEDESEEGHDTEALPDMNAEPEHRDEAQDKKLFAEMMGKMSDYDKERLKSGKPKSLGDRVKKAMMEEKA
jgi:hypothetical protein